MSHFMGSLSLTFDGDVCTLAALAVLDEDAIGDNDEESRECDRGGNKVLFE